MSSNRDSAALGAELAMPQTPSKNMEIATDFAADTSAPPVNLFRGGTRIRLCSLRRLRLHKGSHPIRNAHLDAGARDPCRSQADRTADAERPDRRSDATAPDSHDSARSTGPASAGSTRPDPTASATRRSDRAAPESASAAPAAGDRGTCPRRPLPRRPASVARPGSRALDRTPSGRSRRSGTRTSGAASRGSQLGRTGARSGPREHGATDGAGGARFRSVYPPRGAPRNRSTSFASMVAARARVRAQSRSSLIRFSKVS
jgi:hypothetical protein